MASLTSIRCKKLGCNKLLSSYDARRYAGLCPECYAIRYNRREDEK